MLSRMEGPLGIREGARVGRGDVAACARHLEQRINPLTCLAALKSRCASAPQCHPPIVGVAAVDARVGPNDRVASRTNPGTKGRGSEEVMWSTGIVLATIS